MDKQDPDRSAIDTENCSPGARALLLPGSEFPRSRYNPGHRISTEPTQIFHEDGGMCESKPQKNYKVSKNNDGSRRTPQGGPKE
ncbi:hypothetical protein TWF788_008789 [Orbilia oligospora]|uniref:Uncharacterized protein n=1 Tax=Orbilia oligospora TaxID=2813651 RepID=A0A7C8PFW0_ORBOL|nr:hypothetical protein TWF788_008789 [Orbilia oligospora]